MAKLSKKKKKEYTERHKQWVAANMPKADTHISFGTAKKDSVLPKNPTTRQILQSAQNAAEVRKNTEQGKKAAQQAVQKAATNYQRNKAAGKNTAPKTASKKPALQRAQETNMAVAAELPHAIKNTYSPKALQSGWEHGVTNLTQGTKQGVLALADSPVARLMAKAEANNAAHYVQMAGPLLSDDTRSAVMRQASNAGKWSLEAERRKNAQETLAKQLAINAKYGPLNQGEQIVSDVVANMIPMVPSLVAGVATGGAATLLGAGARGVQMANMAGSMLPMFNYARGLGEAQALNEGATLQQANKYGIATGALEAGTEMLVGGIPGSGVKGFLNPLQRAALNRVKSEGLRKGVDIGMDIAGEGMEEAIAEAADPYFQRGIYNPDAENASLKEIGYAAGMGMLSGGLMKGGAGAVRAMRKLPVTGQQQSAQMQSQQQTASDNALFGSTLEERNAQQEEAAQINAENARKAAELAQRVQEAAEAARRLPVIIPSQQAEPINRMLDDGMSYPQIEDGLQRIEEDHGKENTANAKRAELYVRDATVKGYRNVMGEQIQPNGAFAYRGQTLEQLQELNKRLDESFTGDPVKDAAIIRNQEAVQNLMRKTPPTPVPDIRPRLKRPEPMQQVEQQPEQIDVPQLEQPVQQDDIANYADYDLAKLRPEVKAFLEQVGNKSGFDVVIFDGLPKGANGMYQNGVVYLDGNKVNSLETARKIAAHEVYHELRGTEEFMDLQDIALEYLLAGNKNMKRQQLIQSKMEQYRKLGVEIDTETAYDELTAEFMEQALSDPKVAERIWQERPSLAQRIVDFIQSLMQRFTGHAMSAPEQQQRALLQRAADMYTKGLQSMQYNGLQQQDSQPRQMFAGEKSQTADLDALARAKQMAASGADMESIRQETGWFRSKVTGGKWAYEIDDSNMKFRRGDAKRYTNDADYREYMNAYTDPELLMAMTDERYEELTNKYDNLKTNANAGRLDEFLIHDELFKAYPALRNVFLEFNNRINANGKWSRNDDRFANMMGGAPGTITINDAKANEGTLYHETQHAVQDIEGFPNGASPEYWRENKLLTEAATEKIRQAEDKLAAVEQKFHKLWPNDNINLNLVKRYDKLNDLYFSDMQADESALYQEMSQIEKIMERAGFDELASEYMAAKGELEIIRDSAAFVPPTTAYYNTAGELMARDTARRRNWDAANRRKIAPVMGDENTVYAETGSNSYSIDDNLKRQLDKWLTGNMERDSYFNLGNTPQSLQRLGAKNLPVIMSQEVIVKITGGKHSISLDEIAKLPNQIANPAMTFKGSVPGSFVVLTEMTDKSGNDVIAAIHLSRKQKRMQVNRIASLYGKDNVANYVKNNIDAGNLLDADTKKAPMWFTNRGLQLPKLVQTIIDAKSTIPQNQHKGNNDVRYSLSNNSDMHKQAQLDIVLNSNPMHDDYHSGIRSVDDICTYAEAIENDGMEGDDITPDYTAQMVEKAKKSGKITVYSSYPIGQGVFVTPSKMEAESYAGGGRVHKKVVNLTDVAWIDSMQGQYAQVGDDIRYSLSLNDSEYLDAVNRGDMETAQRLVDMRAAENGYSKKLYHQTGADFTTFNTENQQAGKYDGETPTGIFLKPDSNDIGLSGKKQMQLLSSMTNPLHFNNRDELRRYWIKNIAGYEAVMRNLTENDIKYQRLYDEADERDDALYAQLWRDRRAGRITEEEYRQAIEDSETDDILREWKEQNNVLELQAKSLIDGFMKKSNYDGVIIENDQGSFGRSTKSYIVFDSGQLKSTDAVTYDDAGNPIPLEQRFDRTNNDIRYSLNDKVDQYGAIPAGENPMGNNRDIQVPKRTSDFDKMRKGTRTGMEAEQVADETVAGIQKELDSDVQSGLFTYEPTSNKADLAEANKRIAANGWEETGRQLHEAVLSGRRINSADMATLERLIQEAQKAGQYDKAVDFVSDLAVIGTESGQNIQAIRMLKRLTPEGQLMTLKNAQRRINNSLISKGQPAVPEISGEVAQEFLQARGNKMRGEIWDKEIARMAQQTEGSWLDKLNAIRYAAMLSNPRTHIRNLLGNCAMQAARVPTNIISAALEDTVAFSQKRLKPGGMEQNRSLKNKTGQSSKELRKYAEMAWTADGEAAMRNVGNRYDDVSGQFAQNQRVFGHTKAGNIMEALAGNGKRSVGSVLDAEDMWFKHATYVNTLVAYMKANGITTRDAALNAVKPNGASISKGMEYAGLQARKATFTEDNKLANHISKLENTNLGTQLALGAILPFKKTPMNIITRGIEYSPVGILMTGYKLQDAARHQKTVKEYDELENRYSKKKVSRESRYTVNDVLESLAANATGTILLRVGMELAAAGMLASTGDDEDKRKEQYDQQMGDQNFAVVLDDGSTYTIDWLAPAAMPLLTGVEVYNQLFSGKYDETDDNLVSRALSAAGKIADPVFEMSCMQGVASALASYSGDAGDIASTLTANIGTGYAGQFIPAPVGALARTIDDTVRSSYAAKDSRYTKTGESFLRQQRSKLPGLSKQNEASIDVWGNERKREFAGSDPSDITMRVISNFISPGNYSSNKRTALDDKLTALYETTGDSGVLPKRPDSYIKQDGKNLYLTPLEYSKLSTTKGKKSQEYVSDFVSGSWYQQMDDTEKAKTVKKLYELAGYEAKKEILDKRNIKIEDSEFDKILESKTKYNVSPGEYIGTRKALYNVFNYETSVVVLDELQKMGLSASDFSKASVEAAQTYADKNAKGNPIRDSKKNKTIAACMSRGLTRKQAMYVYEMQQQARININKWNNVDVE